MSLQSHITYLDNIYESTNCNGTCDERPPHLPCPACLATQALNRASEELHDAIVMIKRGKVGELAEMTEEQEQAVVERLRALGYG